MKLLVRATNWVGDAILSIPAMRALREARPDAAIAILATAGVADLYRREDFAGEVLLYERGGRHHGLRGRLRLAAELRERRFDAAILLPNSFDAALLAWLAKIPKRIGYARDGRGPLLTDAIAVPASGAIPAHQRYYYLELLRRAGFIASVPPCDEIRIRADAAAGRRLLRDFGFAGERVVGVSPGAAFGTAKRWLPERFAATAATLASECEAEIAIFGMPAEAELCEAVAREIGSRARSLAGRTSLAGFIDLAATCLLFLSNDSGAMHIAAAAGVPTVAVFGPTDAEATGPVSSLARIVRRPVECSPCLLRECPIDHRCMTGVDPSLVVAEARQLLSTAVHGHAG